MKRTNADFFRDNLKAFDAVLAPMAGVTDMAFRRICVQNNCHITFSEMVSAKGLINQNQSTLEYLNKASEEKCFGVQIFGSTPSVLSHAVELYLNKADLDFIDINMGCPVRKVFSNGDGSALLKDINLVYSVASAVVNASEKPVSAKIRIGVDGVNVAVEAATALSEAGVGLVTVHGRTREQMYSGKADWITIAKVVESVKIPVIANGDVFNVDSYHDIKKITDCEGVMIARGALGNPFIFRQIYEAINTGQYGEISLNERLDTARLHFDYLLESKKEEIAINEFRKHFAWYTKGLRASAALRNEINQLKTRDEIKKKLSFLME